MISQFNVSFVSSSGESVESVQRRLERQKQQHVLEDGTISIWPQFRRTRIFGRAAE
ncbi:hypothetical protein E4U54_003783, partial [Claviceps lovelessii]